MTMAAWGEFCLRAGEFMHRKFLWIMLGAYAVAAIAPWPGHWIRSTRIGNAAFLGQSAGVPLTSLLLALLLFNAGLGIQTGRLRNLLRRPFVLLVGLLANLLVPLLFIVAMSLTLRVWHNPAEVECILVGLALVASMPVAGSSTAWSQNANGDLALSMGLVVLSTCLSPFTTPALLEAVGWLASGAYSECLHTLAGGETSYFLLTFVLAPSLLGIGVRCLFGDGPIQKVKPILKLLNSANLLVLCYSNATVALPQTVANPDWDFLAIVLAIVVALCAIGFASGWAISRLLATDAEQRVSLMFGLGMNNNGTGLVLAATALAHLPSVMLPLILYNLVQHVAAAVTGHCANRTSVARNLLLFRTRSW
ncbi:MAG TPA: bile acid:sodium symporter [Gemmataceae bacterium]|jgi:BASS family bile acid:Na+ symporter|nr:bile acid:sodium symporter [Gemmataceae bacterium]